MLWGNVKGWLKGSRLSKRWQGRILQACVESSVLSDCQARVWYKRDVNKLQRWMDKCYRYVWSDIQLLIHEQLYDGISPQKLNFFFVHATFN